LHGMRAAQRGVDALRKRNYAWQAENLPQLYQRTPFKLSKPE
jgi:hypothetical protein